MIESLVEELTSLNIEDEISNDGSDTSNCPNASENSFLVSLPIVQKILRRKIAFSGQDDASDLLQTISLRLWQWRGKFSGKSDAMTVDEWGSFVARSAYNEINRHHSKLARREELPIDGMTQELATRSIAGETDAEVVSLVAALWKQICCLTVRQKRALLLHSQDVIIYFLQCGISDDAIAEVLGFSLREWLEIKTNLPFSDIQIAELLTNEAKNKSIESQTRSIKKARFEARRRIKMEMK